MKKLLIISAHTGDFVWRSAGTIAKAVDEGAETMVVLLSYGERGESGVDMLNGQYIDPVMSSATLISLQNLIPQTTH